MNKSPTETILFAVSGISPAIITETVWALSQEPDPIIPDRIIIVTTTVGRDRIAAELLTPRADQPSTWESLREALNRAGHETRGKLKFGAIPDHLRVFSATDHETGMTSELDDIRTPEDSAAAADYLLEQLRQFTENPGTRLIASIAGGRKTMSALLYGAMSLLGRKRDRLTHVLVNEPFDSPGLRPRFYFPDSNTPEHALLDREGNRIETVSSSEARVRLTDIPFVRLRDLFLRDLDQLAGHFRTLVEAGSASIEAQRVRRSPPRVTLIPGKQTIVVNGVSVPVKNRRYYVYFAWLVERFEKGQRSQPLKNLVPEFRAWFPDWCQQQEKASGFRYYHLDWTLPATEEEGDDDETLGENLRRIRSNLKKVFRKSLPWFPELEDDLLPARRIDIRLQRGEENS